MKMKRNKKNNTNKLLTIGAVAVVGILLYKYLKLPKGTVTIEPLSPGTFLPNTQISVMDNAQLLAVVDPFAAYQDYQGTISGLGKIKRFSGVPPTC